MSTALEMIQVIDDGADKTLRFPHQNFGISDK